MNIDALIPDLWQRYPFLDDKSLRVRLGGIGEEDVAKWASEGSGDRGEVYNALARHLAVAFHRGALPFAFCDAVMNDLETVILNADDERPDFFWQVYLAFDGGEYARSDKPDEDPVEAYTRPQIASIVEQLPA